MIKEITINNYKSLRDVHVKPEGLNVLVGPNASGKSNFIESMDFISQIYKNGLQHAVAGKGGFHNICFRRYRRSKSGISIKVVSEPQERRVPQKEKYTITTEFEINASSEKLATDFEVKREVTVHRDDSSKDGGAEPEKCVVIDFKRKTNGEYL